jgi:hypothetical protein
VSVFVLGFVFGPLLLGLINGYMGVSRVYNIYIGLFVVFTILSAVAIKDEYTYGN